MPARPLCAHCRQRIVEPQYRPFCSERCKLLDLGRWLSGDYRIAGQPVPPDGAELPDDGSDDPTRHYD